MTKISYRLINVITFYRLAAAPLLVVLLLYQQFHIFKWLLAVSFFTDAIDGWLARTFRTVSLMGARIDSIADDLTVTAAILGMVLYHHAFLRSEWPLIAILLLFYLIQNSIALIRFRKLTSFHTYLAKAAAVLQGVFFIVFYFRTEPLMYLFYIAITVTLLDLAEEIILVAILPKWEADVKGLYWVIRRH